MADAHANFAVSTVATAPSPAASGTSLVVASGEGTRMPAVPFNAVIAPAGVQATSANAEIVRVTGRSSDTLSPIVRTQESSSARTVVVGDRVYAGPTVKTFTDIEAVPQSILEVYVDYVNGDDANHGRSRGNPYKTIQVAYDALVTAAGGYSLVSAQWRGVGRIHLAPGDHNVGSGVVINGWNPVEIYGTRSGLGAHTLSTSASRIVTTSAAATAMITVAHTSPSDGISRGFRIRDVGFVPDTAVNTALTSCILLRSIIEAEVSWCSFDVADGTTTSTITAIYQQQLTGAGDNMGLRLLNNFSSRLQFYKAAAAGGGTNFNRIVIRENRCGYEHLTNPTIHLEGDFRSGLVGPNQMQGAATHIKLDSTNCDGNVFLHNAGESQGSIVNPFIDFATGNITSCVVIGGDVTTGASSTKTVTAATNASPIAITTSAVHGFTTGDTVTVASVGGNTAANSTWTIIVTSTTAFTLTGSTGNGAYTSGGTAYGHGVYLRFGASSKGNIYIGGGSATGVASSGLKDRVVDNSTTYQNRIFSSEYGLPLKIAAGATVADTDFRTPPANGTLALASDGAVWKKMSNGWVSTDKYKSGAGVTALADADFAATPANGTVGIVHNTTTGSSYLTCRVNGVWKTVQVS